jgi:hypothetical protein
MAGTIVSDYAIGDANLDNIMLTLDKAFKGEGSITLTEMLTTTVPEIAAGSWVENNGALYKFDSNESISTTDPVTSTTVADGEIYLCLVPQSGSASGATTDATGYNIGATSITLASAGTGDILAGDIIQFAGDINKYTITSGDGDVSNGGTITIASPGLQQAIPASATAITIVGGSLSAAFTATAPVWSDSKQGYYGSGALANYRHIASMEKSTASYTDKRQLYKNWSDDYNKKYIAHVEGNQAHSGSSVFPSLSFDTNNTSFNFQLSGGDVLIPVTGLYHVSMRSSTGGTTASTHYFRVNGARNISNVLLGISYTAGAAQISYTSGCIYLEKGDLIDMEISPSGGSGSTFASMIIARFC